MRKERTAPEERIAALSRYHDGFTGACWLWTGHIDDDGYGRVTKRGRAHNIAYTLLVGPIPEGLELDHLCRNRACVNPAHLEPVTHAENTRRGIHTGPYPGSEPRTHCKRGHEYTPENTHRDPDGHRVCRACSAENQRRYRSRRSA